MNQFAFSRAAIFAFSIALLALSYQSPSCAREQDELQLPAPVSARKNIRFYKVNKQLQADRIRLTDKKAASSGCQNFLKSVRVHRTIQTGFTVCFLYAEKNCEADSIVAVAREEQPRQTSLLTEGIGWMPQSDEPRGVDLGSWSCGFEVEPEQLAYEAELAALEVERLAIIAATAVQRAAIAQQKADQAQESAENAIEQAAVAMRRAIAAGVIMPEEQDVIGAEVITDEPTAEQEQE